MNNADALDFLYHDKLKDSTKIYLIAASWKTIKT